MSGLKLPPLVQTQLPYYVDYYLSLFFWEGGVMALVETKLQLEYLHIKSLAWFPLCLVLPGC